MQKIFGTDGARGVYGEDITPQLAFDIGRALAVYTKAEKNILIAKDTRISSDVLLTSFVSGATSMGANVIYMGLVTTPCLSYITSHGDFACGVMITASHNSFEFNGIKIFKSNGEKLGVIDEKKLTYIYKNLSNFSLDKNSKCGKFSIKYGLTQKYINYLKSLIKDKFFDVSVAFDCANGVSYKILTKLFDNNFKNMYFINTSQNGKKVNQDCGATDTRSLSDFVVKNGIDIGFAFDGDGDRVITVNSRGEMLDGDDILYNLALSFKKRKMLNKNTVVGTSMTNMALQQALKAEDIDLVRVDVGDKYIVDKLNQEGLSLGGEKAGHIIAKRYTNTGDGVLIALVVLINCRVENIKKINNLPQKIVNIDCSKKAKESFVTNKIFESHLTKIKNEYKDYRIVVRPSGTENKLRIMVEGESLDIVENIIEQINNKIVKLL